MATAEIVQIRQIPEELSAETLTEANGPVAQILGGNKRLTITLVRSIWMVSTYVENCEGSKVSGLTTRLYGQAYGLMQDIANLVNHDLYYRFFTGFETMATWAQGPGRQVFTWDRESFKETGAFEANKIIRPINLTH